MSLYDDNSINLRWEWKKDLKWEWENGKSERERKGGQGGKRAREVGLEKNRYIIA